MGESSTHTNEYPSSFFSSSNSSSSLTPALSSAPLGGYSFGSIVDEPKKRSKKKFNELLKEFGTSSPQVVQRKLAVHMLGFLQETGRIEPMMSRSNPLASIPPTEKQGELLKQMHTIVQTSADSEMYDFVVPSSFVWRYKHKAQKFKSPSKKYWKLVFQCDTLLQCFFRMLLVILLCDSAEFIEHLGLFTREIRDDDLKTLRFALWDYFVVMIPKEVDSAKIKAMRSWIPNSE